MSVDLNGIGQGQVNTQRTTADKPANSQNAGQTAPEQTKAQSARGENVSLSSQARNLKQLEQKLGDYPEMDDDRIEQIRSALENGTYKVDAENWPRKCLRWIKAFSGE